MELQERITDAVVAELRVKSGTAHHFADLAPGQARLVDWTPERYHADVETVSRSQLEDLRASPSLFHAKHVARTLPPEPPTAAMRLGTHVHLAVLEPSEWQRRLGTRAPGKPYRPADANGKAKVGSAERSAYESWKADCDEWESEMERWRLDQPEDVLQLGGERERIEAIAAAVRSHRFAAELLGRGGSNEQTVVWRHPETELLVRVRADRIQSTDPTTRTVFDLKTTSDPSPDRFGRSIANFGYHRQGALYLDAVQALYPQDELHFVLCVVRSTPPYEVACYELDESDLALGRSQYLRTMNDLVRRRRDNDWLAEWQLSCHSINLPGWAHYEEN
jgi:hypothetical protein